MRGRRSFNGSVGPSISTSMCMPSCSTGCSPARLRGVCGFILRRTVATRYRGPRDGDRPGRTGACSRATASHSRTTTRWTRWRTRRPFWQRWPPRRCKGGPGRTPPAIPARAEWGKRRARSLRTCVVGDRGAVGGLRPACRRAGAGGASRPVGARVPLCPAAADRGRSAHRYAAGEVVVQLRRPWANGTTHLAFPPTAFLGRLAVLVPRPHVNLLLYHGVLAPRAAWRAEVVPQPAPSVDPETSDAPATNAPPSGRGWRWADLMRRVFDMDVLVCACGGRLRLIAVIEASDATVRILRHLRLPEAVPAPRPSRAPPLGDWAAQARRPPPLNPPWLASVRPQAGPPGGVYANGPMRPLITATRPRAAARPC